MQAGGKSWASGSAAGAAGLHSSVSSRPRSGIAAEPAPPPQPPPSLLLQTGGKLPSGAYTQTPHEHIHHVDHGVLDAVYAGGHADFVHAPAHASSNRSSVSRDSHAPPTPYPPQYDAPAVAAHPSSVFGAPQRLSQSDAPGSVSLYIAADDTPVARAPSGVESAVNYASRDTLGPMVPYGAAAVAPHGEWDARRAALERSVESSMWRETADASAQPYGDAPSEGGGLAASTEGATAASIAARSYVHDAAPPMFAPAHARTPSETGPPDGFDEEAVGAASPPEPEGPRAVTPGPALARRGSGGASGGTGGFTRSFEHTVAGENLVDATHDDVVDMLEAVHAAGARFLGQYELLSGVHQRFGGQGVVQFAQEVAPESDDGARLFTLPSRPPCLARTVVSSYAKRHNALNA